MVTGVLSNMGEWRAELDKWKEKADRDELTGLYNRSFFERWVSRQLETPVHGADGLDGEP